MKLHERNIWSVIFKLGYGTMLSAICLIGTVFEGSLLCILQRLDFERPSRGSDHSGHIWVEVQTVLLRVVGSLLGNRGVSLPYVGNQG